MTLSGCIFKCEPRNHQSNARPLFLSLSLIHTEDHPRSQFLLSRAEETVRVSESRAWYRVYSTLYGVMQRTNSHSDTGPVEII